MKDYRNRELILALYDSGIRAVRPGVSVGMTLSGCGRVNCVECGATAGPVSTEVVRRLVREDLVEAVPDGNYGICSNPDCDITYFDPSTGVIFYTEDLAVPPWFKQGAHPKYACSIYKVTFEEVEEFARTTDRLGIPEILRGLRSEKCLCTPEERLGSFCSEAFSVAIRCGIPLSKCH